MLLTRSLCWTVAIAASTVAPPARADASRCIADHEQGQVAQKAARLVEARDRFTACAAADCPGTIAKECAELLRTAEASLPTLVLAVTDAEGNDVTAVTVKLDGQVIARDLDGRAITVDPGARRFRFERGDGSHVEQTVLVREGEKNREIRARFAAARAAADPSPPDADAATAPEDGDRGLPAATLIFAGVGVVGLGVFGAFALDGKAKETAMTDPGGCAPTCSEREVSSMRQSYLVADIGLGVGLASLAAAGYFWATAGAGHGGDATTALRWAPLATPSSAGAAVHGRF